MSNRTVSISLKRKKEKEGIQLKKIGWATKKMAHFQKNWDTHLKMRPSKFLGRYTVLFFMLFLLSAHRCRSFQIHVSKN
jgi:hypothetical protein